MSETTTIEFGTATAGGSVTGAVIEGIAAVADCDPMEIDVRLAEHVDPDALEALFEESATTNCTIELTATIDRFHVTVNSSGYVTVSRRAISSEADEAAVGI